MGSKSQRKKERHNKKRQAKRKKQQQATERNRPRPFVAVSLGNNARHRQRLLQQVPQAWPGELPEDIAVFDDTVLATLPAELAQQVTAVRTALQAASESRGDDALEQTSTIPRSSPLSEWRLFIRGLVSWLADETTPAGETWRRLDAGRRPGRIATAMMLALRSDLDQISRSGNESLPGQPADDSPEQRWNQWDEQLLYHARLLRKVRFDRSAIRIAQAGVNIADELPDLRIGLGKIQWLQQFAVEYAETEPELVAALSQAALDRAGAQTYVDVYNLAVKSLRGPRHDPGNLLHSFRYYSKFQDEKSLTLAQKVRDAYLKELPDNQAISKALRGAIISQLHLEKAEELLNPDESEQTFAFWETPVEDTKAIREHLIAAEKAYPGNRAAYETHVEWIESKLDDERVPGYFRLSSNEKSRFENQLPEIMKRWSKGLPEDIRPRLWLVDYLLENEELDEARPHAEFLSASRHDDPRVRATPWKWQLLEAMRLCRRKSWFSEVPARLEEADRLWPEWLSRQWLPYLKAAWTLRSGRTAEFDEQHRRICEESGLQQGSLADACMMLGAAQRMRVTGDDLKPLRAAVDRWIGRIRSTSFDQLLDVGSFFWDMHRVKLVYPAFRMHGQKIGKAFIAGLANSNLPREAHLNDERIHKTILWASEYRSWWGNSEIKLPYCYKTPALSRHPIPAAARLNAFLKRRMQFHAEKFREDAAILREAAQTQRDTYYRYWFVELADKLDDILAKKSSDPFATLFSNIFSNIFSAIDGDDSGDDDDD